MALKNTKPVSKEKINGHVAEILKRANLVLTNIKQGQDLNITKINNLLYATEWAITDMVDRTLKKDMLTSRDKIELEIKKLRTNISIIEELQKGSNVKYAKAESRRNLA